MARTIEELIHVEARLNRAFLGYLCAVSAGLLWPMLVGGRLAEPSAALVIAALAMFAVQVGVYVWFATAAGAAARALGGTSWHYVAWILAAPFVALLPIPLVAMVVAASPLSIKFLLGGQLHTAIREQTSMALHVSA